jgi:hypothetical protein
VALDDAQGRIRGLHEHRRSRVRALVAFAVRVEVPVIGLWLALAAVLAVITRRVVDWYVMTDELLYERLALSIGHLHSPLPRVHGEIVANVNQLYPLLLAPFFAHGLVPAALHNAHIANAFVMSSASIPAFFLTRRVTQRRALSYLAAALSVCIPWIALSSFLLTEVVAYPAFLWALLACQHAIVSPRARNDALALAALGIAILARTQFAVLLVVLPASLLLHQVVFVDHGGGSRLRRVYGAAANVVSAHRVFAGAYAALVLAAIGVAAAGRIASVLGTYSVTAEGNLVPSGMGRSLLAHLAAVSLGIGILPFVVGAGWLLTTIVAAKAREQHAFASLATVTIVALLFEVTSYDLRFGAGLMHDRYLFYVVPLVLIALAGAYAAGAWPTWSLLPPAALVATGFLFLPMRRFDKFNVDSPAAALNGVLRDLGGSVTGARLLLALGTVVATALVVEARVLLRRPRLVTVLIGTALLALPAETGFSFSRIFAADGTSGRPITLDQGVVFDWIDRRLGPTAKVTMLPYGIYGDYWANGGYWWNVEFWNASIQREAIYRGGLSWTPETFPKTTLRLDPSTGRANLSPSSYLAQADRETRFRLAGRPDTEYRGVLLLKAARPWRAEWMSFGLYDDGWTTPKVTARIRIFSSPGQRTSMVRYLTISVRTAPDVAQRSFRVRSNMTDSRAQATQRTASYQFGACVPPHGYADVSLRSAKYSPIYGDPQSLSHFTSFARSGGVRLMQIALADETRPC